MHVNPSNWLDSWPGTLQNWLAWREGWVGWGSGLRPSVKVGALKPVYDSFHFYWQGRLGVHGLGFLIWYVWPLRHI